MCVRGGAGAGKRGRVGGGNLFWNECSFTSWSLLNGMALVKHGRAMVGGQAGFGAGGAVMGGQAGFGAGGAAALR